MEKTETISIGDVILYQRENRRNKSKGVYLYDDGKDAYIVPLEEGRTTKYSNRTLGDQNKDHCEEILIPEILGNRADRLTGVKIKIYQTSISEIEPFQQRLLPQTKINILKRISDYIKQQSEQSTDDAKVPNKPYNEIALAVAYNIQAIEYQQEKEKKQEAEKIKEKTAARKLRRRLAKRGLQ